MENGIHRRAGYEILKATFKEVGCNCHQKKHTYFCKNTSGYENNITCHTTTYEPPHTHTHTAICTYLIWKNNNTDMYILHICLYICLNQFSEQSEFYIN